MFVDLKRTVVVFDLDDTLYPEADYVDSGVRYVCAQINSLCGNDCYEVIQAHRLHDAKLDWLSLACELSGLKPSVKESLLWMYRLHLPNIRLSENCSVSLEKIKTAAGCCCSDRWPICDSKAQVNLTWVKPLAVLYFGRLW